MNAYPLNSSTLFGDTSPANAEFDFTKLAQTSATSAFVVTENSDKWLQLSIFTTTLYAYLFYKFEMKVSNKQIAYFSLALSAFSFIPFLAYAINGIAWTGLELGEIQRKMIDKRHAVAMFIWVGLSVVQLIAYLLKQQQLHNKVGRFLMNYLLPFIFFELAANAAFVFVPDKPSLAAHAVAAIHQDGIPTGKAGPMEVLAFMFTEAMALLTPLHMIMYWWLSWAAVDSSDPTGKKNKKDIRLHIVYASLLITTMSGAGILRWYIQREFYASGCPQREDKAISALLQTMGHSWSCFTYPAIYIGIYCTVPLKQRQTNKNLQRAFWFHLMTSTFLGPVAAYIMEIPAGITCMPNPVTMQ